MVYLLLWWREVSMLGKSGHGHSLYGFPTGFFILFSHSTAGNPMSHNIQSSSLQRRRICGPCKTLVLHPPNSANVNAVRAAYATSVYPTLMFILSSTILTYREVKASGELALWNQIFLMWIPIYGKHLIFQWNKANLKYKIMKIICRWYRKIKPHSQPQLWNFDIFHGHIKIRMTVLCVTSFPKGQKWHIFTQ